MGREPTIKRVSSFLEIVLSATLLVAGIFTLQEGIAGKSTGAVGGVNFGCSPHHACCGQSNPSRQVPSLAPIYAASFQARCSHFRVRRVIPRKAHSNGALLKIAGMKVLGIPSSKTLF